MQTIDDLRTWQFIGFLVVEYLNVKAHNERLRERPDYATNKFFIETSERLEYLETVFERLNKDVLPSGSGFNAGTKILLDECKLDKIVIQTCFHRFNDVGYYEAWSEHKVILTPVFGNDFEMAITGRNKNGIKDYIYDVFYWIFMEFVETGFSPSMLAFCHDYEIVLKLKDRNAIFHK